VEEEGAVDAKTEMGKDKWFSPPSLDQRPRQLLFLNLEGSAICDQQYELILRGEVSPFKDSTTFSITLIPF
jgi:hypothetical protein